jgi:two-component system, OmpR family, sensor histidine kinase KdpD
MSRIAWRLLRIVGCILAMWAVARIVFVFLPREDAIAAMILLLCVLAAATLGDRVLAVAGSVAASLSFNYYYIGPVYSLHITSAEDAVNVGVFIIVALTGSHLSIRAQLRAEESERRRREMERLQQLGAALLATDTVSEAASRAIREIVNLFGGGAVLKVDGIRFPFEAGVIGLAGGEPIVVRTPNEKGILELYGMEPSVEVRSALANLIGLVLDRASAAEERARIESTQRGEELRNTILNALAHNFRTPLTCIKAAASMMRGSGGVPGSYSQELVEVIDEEADRLDELIRDSLDLARIQTRQANPRVEDCAVAAIVSGVLEKMKRYLARQLIVVNIPDGLPAVRGDRFLFEQMVTQVLDNAWKYGGPGACIWVSAHQTGDEVVLAIRNEGAQIPTEERGLVFDRFYRGTRSRAASEGTGLGLAIAKTIVEAHGGRVWLEPAEEGPEFRFALPAGTTEEEAYDREPNYIVN